MTTRPERPILDAAADRLDRGPFIGRLCDALVDPAGHARGVVVGITGPWGSGKSSLLNMLETEVERRHPAAVVVRFDPWLVSGRDDVITQFFAELLATIHAVGTTQGRAGDTLTDLANTIARYAKDLAPAAGLLSLVPGVGAAVAAAAKAAETLTTRDTSLAAQRRTLTEMLAGVVVPIIVLIDELDRVDDDSEIRAVAQLVRAVADFPGISYVLAYDRERVVEALGHGNAKRGNAYLEKIVQFQIPLPVSLEEEMRTLLRIELDALSQEGHVPTGWHDDPRLKDLLDIAVPSLVATPRDVRRVTGVYAVLAPMVHGEVEWVDLLGYGILLCKTPTVIDEIRRRPEEVVIDPLSEDVLTARYIRDQKTNHEERLQDFGVAPSDPAAPLLGFLFPRFTEERRTVQSGDTICHRRPLLTLLRLGMLPGAVPRQEVLDFLTLEGAAMTADLRRRFSESRLGAFLDRFDSLYHDMEDPDPQRTWRSIGSFLEPAAPAWPIRFSEIPDVLHAFERVLLRSLARRPPLRTALREVLVALIERHHYAFAASILRNDFFAYGLFGKEERGADHAFLSAADVTDLARRLAKAAHEDQARGAMLPSMHTLESLYLMQEVGQWDDPCRQRLDEAIRTDDAAVIGMAILGFGGFHRVNDSDMQRFTDSAALVQRFREVLETHGAQLDPSARQALERALRF